MVEYDNCFNLMFVYASFFRMFSSCIILCMTMAVMIKLNHQTGVRGCMCLSSMHALLCIHGSVTGLPCLGTEEFEDFSQTSFHSVSSYLNEPLLMHIPCIVNSIGGTHSQCQSVTRI